MGNDRAGAAVALRVTPPGVLARPDRDAVAAEGEGLLRFLAPDGPVRRVRFAPAG